MTVTFWIAASALMALVIGLLAWPLLGHRSATRAASRRAINIAIYKDQLAEMGRDRDNGVLAATDYDRAREELDRRVLEDTAEEPTAAVSAPANRLPRTALALLVAIPLVAVPLYVFLLGTPEALNPQAEASAKGGHDQDMTPERLAKLAAGLAAKLEKEPDPKGFIMLGRSYKALGRLDEAEKAFAKGGSMMDTEPVLMLEQVELAAFKNDGRLTGKPLDLLQKLLQLEPDNPMALVYAGTNAYYGQKYAKAIEYWERLLKQVDPNSDDAKNLNGGISKARQLMSGKGPAPTALPWAETSAQAAPQQEAVAAAPQNAAPAAGPGASIVGSVDLDPALKAKASPGDTVFIFAKAVSGPRMPLAVVRAKVSDLPMAFTLDDSTAMRPELKLSLAGEVRVEARVSKTGNAIGAPGDLIGGVGPLKPGARDVKIHIDKLVP